MSLSQRWPSSVSPRPVMAQRLHLELQSWLHCLWDRFSVFLKSCLDLPYPEWGHKNCVPFVANLLPSGVFQCLVSWISGTRITDFVFTLLSDVFLQCSCAFFFLYCDVVGGLLMVNRWDFRGFYIFYGFLNSSEIWICMILNKQFSFGEYSRGRFPRGRSACLSLAHTSQKERASS